MRETILSIIENSEITLRDAKNNFDSFKTIEIGGEYFHSKYCFEENITHDPKLKFREILTINNPILYWFELTDSSKNTEIRETYQKYRTSIKNKEINTIYRNTSSYKSTFDEFSTTLYIGKIESGF